MNQTWEENCEANLYIKETLLIDSAEVFCYSLLRDDYLIAIMVARSRLRLSLDLLLFFVKNALLAFFTKNNNKFFCAAKPRKNFRV